MINGMLKHENGRSGIALVIVLGMLAVMVLMGVAFSISMRTERMAASAYVDIVRARSLMDSALGQVVTEHIPAVMEFEGDDFYPSWFTDPPDTGAGGENFTDEIGIRYVPGVLHDRARGADDLDWVDIEDPETGRFYGQYAFMIVNTSGLLDANHVSGANRAHGAGPEELQIIHRVGPDVILPEATYVPPPEEEGGPLGRWRDNWFQRFETLPELYALGIWDAQDDGTPQSPSIVDQDPPFRPRPSYVNHFQVFSHYPDEEFIAPTGDPLTFEKANVAGSYDDDEDESGWDSDANIIAVLTQQPNPPFDSNEEAADFLTILKDYTRDGQTPWIPDDPGGFSFTRVPMINEVVVSNSFARAPVSDFDPDEPRYDFSIRIHVAVETWYPFPEPSAMPGFSVRMEEPPQVFESAQFPAFGEWNTTMEEESVDTPTSHTGGPDDYRVWRFTYEAEASDFDWSDLNDLVAFPIRILIEDPIDVVLLDGDEVVGEVNRVNGTWPQASFQSIIPGAQIRALPADGDFVPLGQYAAMSANDPRLNWDPANTLQWQSSLPHTLGEPNDTLSGPPDEVNQLMYCAHRPLRSVGELSYLLHNTNTPWTTVRLLGPDPDNTSRVVDRLKIHEEPTRRGLVNINSPHVPVLQTAFYAAPVEQFRNAPGARGSVTVAEARELALRIRDGVENLPGRARNLSDLSQLSGLTVNDVSSILGLTAPNKFEAESVVRNTMGMLGTRDTLYTVFLITRTFPRGFNPDPTLSEIEVPSELDLDEFVVAEQRAVALIWRDPALVDGANRTIVRSFIWLTEEE